MSNKNNPLSPHLQVYKWHISSLLSISHRIVGIINFIFIILISSILIFLGTDIQISATCVRVPVMVSHSESINVEFEKPFDIKSIKNILNQSNGCKVIDERKDGGYITPLEAENSYLTFISRIRKDSSNNKAINMWVVSDNLLKGAALNTVQIAEQLIKKNV